MEKATPAPFRILVLATPENRSGYLVKAAETLASRFGATVRILHVKAPASAIQQDNQFSAKKELYEDSRQTRKKLQDLAGPAYSKAVDLRYGNVKGTVMEAMAENAPQVVVMGKRVRKVAGILGDRLTDAVLDSAPGSVLILDEAAGLDSFTAGVYAPDKGVNLGPWEHVIQEGASNTRYFSIGKSSFGETESDPAKQHFVFTDDADSLERVISFATKTRTDLFCIPKGVQKSLTRKLVRGLQGSVLVVR